jgi:hypothetical protein
MLRNVRMDFLGTKGHMCMLVCTNLCTPKQVYTSMLEFSLFTRCKQVFLFLFLFFQTESCSIAWSGLEPMILLPQPPEC